MKSIDVFNSMNGFIDGKTDCAMDGTCPLYTYMPYKKKKK